MANNLNNVASAGTDGQLLGNSSGTPTWLSESLNDFGFTTADAGVTRTLTISNTDNSNTASNATGQITTGGGSAGDPKTTYTVTGVTSFSTGIDNSASDAFKISASTALGTTDTFVMTTAGERTMPLQPAFLAQNSATDSNVTGDNTSYTIICDTEIYDQGSDYNNATGVFTAPVTGRYLFTTTVFLTELTASHTSVVFELVASNRDARGYGYTNATAGMIAGNMENIALCYVDMDAADTIFPRIRVAGSTKTVDVYGEATQLYTSFAGALIC